MIAGLLMLTGRRVQQLTSERVLPKAERGQYELVPVVQAYVRYLRERSVSGDLDGDDADIGKLEARMIKARTQALPEGVSPEVATILRHLEELIRVSHNDRGPTGARQMPPVIQGGLSEKPVPGDV
jgi:hypothetical protein